jgi:hypothetical protein
VQPTVETVRGGGRKRALSATLDRDATSEVVCLDTSRSRLPSPLLVADISFRENHLIDHYFQHPFRRQFCNNAIRGTKIPTPRYIHSLIDRNPALRHAVCALACLTFPSHPPPSQQETIAHAGLALAFLRKLIGSQYLDESTLLAIVEVVDFEVYPTVPMANCSAARCNIPAGLSISTPR